MPMNRINIRKTENGPITNSLIQSNLLTNKFFCVFFSFSQSSVNGGMIFKKKDEMTTTRSSGSWG